MYYMLVANKVLELLWVTEYWRGQFWPLEAYISETGKASATVFSLLDSLGTDLA
jgi:hypothetical protein